MQQMQDRGMQQMQDLLMQHLKVMQRLKVKPEQGQT
jgi:hypothetical protein